jgi:hypothetical protein
MGASQGGKTEKLSGVQPKQVEELINMDYRGEGRHLPSPSNMEDRFISHRV